MKTAYLFCIALCVGLVLGTTSSLANPSASVIETEAISANSGQYVPAETDDTAPTITPAVHGETSAPHGFWFYFKRVLFCLRDLIIGFGFGAIGGGLFAGLFSRTKFTVKRVIIKGAIIGSLLTGAASIVTAYDTYFNTPTPTECRLPD